MGLHVFKHGTQCRRSLLNAWVHNLISTDRQQYMLAIPGSIVLYSAYKNTACLIILFTLQEAARQNYITLWMLLKKTKTFLENGGCILCQQNSIRFKKPMEERETSDGRTVDNNGHKGNEPRDKMKTSTWKLLKSFSITTFKPNMQ